MFYPPDCNYHLEMNNDNSLQTLIFQRLSQLVFEYYVFLRIRLFRNYWENRKTLKSQRYYDAFKRPARLIHLIPLVFTSLILGKRFILRSQ